MILMGHEFETVRALVVGGLISFLWLMVILTLSVRWLRQVFLKIKTMTSWDWAELSGWILAISVLTTYDSYLIFYR